MKLTILVLLIVASCMSQDQGSSPPISDGCLKCICDTVTECNLDEGCNGYTCGPFRITKPYWIDAGNFTVNGESLDSETAFENCASNYDCSVQTVQGYMATYGQDCNEDGVINCYDHGAIHQLGRYGCGGELPEKYFNDFSQCYGQA